MDLRGKTIDDLRGELELIDRTIVALEKLGRLRSESIAKAASASERNQSTKITSLRKSVQAQ